MRSPSRRGPPPRRPCRPRSRPPVANRASGSGPIPIGTGRVLGERADCDREATVSEHGRKDSVGELSQLRDRDVELGLRDLQAGPALARCERRELRAEQAQRERERDEPLLRAVVQVALDAFALASPVSTIRVREARRSARRARTSAWRRSFSSARRAAAVTSSTSCSSSSSAASVREHGDGAPVADEARPRRACGELDRAPVRVDEPAAIAERIGEDEFGIAEHCGENVAQASWRRRVRKFDDEAGNR